MPCVYAIAFASWILLTPFFPNVENFLNANRLQMLKHADCRNHMFLLWVWEAFGSLWFSELLFALWFFGLNWNLCWFDWIYNLDLKSSCFRLNRFNFFFLNFTTKLILFVCVFARLERKVDEVVHIRELKKVLKEFKFKFWREVIKSFTSAQF